MNQNSSKPIKRLILVASTTPAKCLDYSVAAQDGTVVMLLSDFFVHHAAPELGKTSKENLNEKWDAIKDIVWGLRKGGKYHHAFMAELEMRGLEFEGGPAMAAERTAVLCDDTILVFPKGPWEKAAPDLEELIVPKVVQNSLIDSDFKKVPGHTLVVDTGSILGGSEQRKFWNIMAKAANSFPDYWDGMTLYNNVECGFGLLGGPKPSFQSFSSHNPLIFLPNEQNAEAEQIRAKTPVLTTENFVYMPDKLTMPIACDEALYNEYWGRQSSRAIVLRQIEDQIDANVEQHSPAVSEEFHQTATQALADPTRTIVVITTKTPLIDPETLVFPGIKARIRKIVVPSEDETFEQLNKGESLRNVQSLKFSFGHADGFVVVPSSQPLTLNQRRHFVNITSTLRVAQETDPAYHNVPVVFANANGELDFIKALWTQITTLGLDKNVLLHPIHFGFEPHERLIQTPGVDAMPFLGGTFLNGVNPDAVRVGVGEMMSILAPKFHWIPKERYGQRRSGSANVPSEGYPVGVYTSASSDRRDINEDSYDIGRMLGKLASPRAPLVVKHGGGNMHAMEGVLRGLKETRDLRSSYLELASTHGICKTETRDGKLPLDEYDADYGALFDDIGPRVDFMSSVKHVLSTGGGHGTTQEISYAEIKGRKITLSTCAARPYIEAVYGKSGLSAAIRNPYALASYNLTYFPRIADAEKDITASYRSHVAQVCDNSTFIPFPGNGELARLRSSEASLLRNDSRFTYS